MYFISRSKENLNRYFDNNLYDMPECEDPNKIFTNNINWIIMTDNLAFKVTYHLNKNTY